MSTPVMNEEYWKNVMEMIPPDKQSMIVERLDDDRASLIWVEGFKKGRPGLEEIMIQTFNAAMDALKALYPNAEIDGSLEEDPDMIRVGIQVIGNIVHVYEMLVNEIFTCMHIHAGTVTDGPSLIKTIQTLRRGLSMSMTQYPDKGPYLSKGDAERVFRRLNDLQVADNMFHDPMNTDPVPDVEYEHREGGLWWIIYK